MISIRIDAIAYVHERERSKKSTTAKSIIRKTISLTMTVLEKKRPSAQMMNKRTWYIVIELHTSFGRKV